MASWDSFDEVLDFAIGCETQSVLFYRELAEKMATPVMRIVFLDFALEEEGHQRILQGIKNEGQMERENAKVPDLKIGNYLVAPDPEAIDDYPRALILAMAQEEAARNLYLDMASNTHEPQVVALLETLAREEARHKLRFQVEYDEHVLKDN